MSSPSCLLSLLWTVIGAGARQERGPYSLFGHDLQGCNTRPTLPLRTHISLSVPSYRRRLKVSDAPTRAPRRDAGRCPKKGCILQWGARRVGAGTETGRPLLEPPIKAASTGLDWHCPCGLIIITTIIGAAGVEGTQTTPPWSHNHHCSGWHSLCTPSPSPSGQVTDLSRVHYVLSPRGSTLTNPTEDREPRVLKETAPSGEPASEPRRAGGRTRALRRLIILCVSTADV